MIDFKQPTNNLKIEEDDLKNDITHFESKRRMISEELDELEFQYDNLSDKIFESKKKLKFVQKELQLREKDRLKRES